MKQEHLNYLDGLHKSKVTNMFGARPYLINEYPDLSEKEATKILLYWMENFDESGTKISEKEQEWKP